MAARRRAGSFSPKTSFRLRVNNVDMLWDMACLLVSRFDSILGCPSFFWEPESVAAIGDAVVRDAASSAIANKLFLKFIIFSFQSDDWTALALLSSADAILATIDDNCLSGDKCRIIAGQKKYCACHIRRFSQPLDRLLFPGGAFLCFRLGRACQRIRQAGQY